MRGLHHFKIRG
jgi:hypothetical protein